MAGPTPPYDENLIHDKNPTIVVEEVREKVGAKTSKKINTLEGNERHEVVV